MRETSLCPLVIIFFTDRSKAVLLLWTIFVFMFPVCDAFLFVHCSLVFTCWERAGLLAILCLMFYCVLSLSSVVSWVRCGTCLLHYLIVLIPDLCLLTYITCTSFENDVKDIVWSLCFGYFQVR